MRAVELSEAECEKSVRQLILEQMRRNGDDLASLKRDITSLSADVIGLRDDLTGKVDSLHHELTLLCEAVHDFAMNLPRMVRDAAREALREWDSEL